MIAEAVDVDVRSAEGYTVLQACIECQSEDRHIRLKMVIGAGADLNALGWMFQTAPHRAALREDEVAMKMLLAAGADRSVRSTIDGCETLGAHQPHPPYRQIATQSPVGQGKT